MVVQELPGRLWDGKEALLAAVAALCKAAPRAVMASPHPASSSKAVAGALMAALARKKQTYRSAPHHLAAGVSTALSHSWLHCA